MDILVQLPRLPNDLLLIPLARLRRRLLLALVRKVGRLHPHFLRLPKSKTGIIQHLDRQIDGLGSEVDDQCIAFELAPVVLVHLDPGLTAIDLLGYDAAFGEDGADFFEGGVGWKGGHVDRCVDAGPFGFLDRLVLESPLSDRFRLSCYSSAPAVHLTSSPLTCCFFLFLGAAAGASSSTPSTR